MSKIYISSLNLIRCNPLKDHMSTNVFNGAHVAFSTHAFDDSATQMLLFFGNQKIKFIYETFSIGTFLSTLEENY